jgi:hypothetical protein
VKIEAKSKMDTKRTHCKLWQVEEHQLPSIVGYLHTQFSIQFLEVYEQKHVMMLTKIHVQKFSLSYLQNPKPHATTGTSHQGLCTYLTQNAIQSNENEKTTINVAREASVTD